MFRSSGHAEIYDLIGAPIDGHGGAMGCGIGWIGIWRDLNGGRW